MRYSLTHAWHHITRLCRKLVFKHYSCRYNLKIKGFFIIKRFKIRIRFAQMAFF